MSNLIPVRRMDKNGVMTTKWVSAQPDEPTGRGSIPAPSLIPQQSVKQLYSPKYGREVDVQQTEVAMLYRRSMIDNNESHDISDFDPKVLQAIEYMVQEAQSKGLGYKAESEVKTTFNMVGARMVTGREPYAALNNLAVFGDAVIHPDTVHDDIHALIAGVEPYFKAKDFMHDVTDEEREQAVVLVTAAARIRPPMVKMDGAIFADDRTITIDSRELNEFILSRPDDVERIARVVNDRETVDVDTIRNIIDHEQQSLRDGVL